MSEREEIRKELYKVNDRFTGERFIDYVQSREAKLKEEIERLRIFRADENKTIVKLQSKIEMARNLLQNPTIEYCYCCEVYKILSEQEESINGK